MILEELAELVKTEFAKMEVEENTYVSLKNSINAAKTGNYNFYYGAPVLIVTANRKGYGNAIADRSCYLDIISRIEKMKLVQLDSAMVKSIYRERLVFDFPRDELKPLIVILELVNKGIYECLGLWDENDLAGYVFLVKKNKDYLIDYLAVYPDKRNSGIGGEMLALLTGYLADADNVLLEIEDPDMCDDIDEKEIQTRRRAFYLRNNCRDMGLRFMCFQVPFQILVLGENKSESFCDLREVYVSFYRMILPKFVFEKNIVEYAKP